MPQHGRVHLVLHLICFFFIYLTGGNTGVFDLDDLVTVLKEENARDLCVISVPAHINYVDYLVLVNGISPRHIKAMADLMKWLVSPLFFSLCLLHFSLFCSFDCCFVEA